MGKIEDLDSAYIWLRQTAELTLGDQRRTLEIAVPVRPGATPDEIARLLDEAETGMERLAERMDRRVAALRSSTPAAPGAPAASAQVGPGARVATPSARPTGGVAERPPAPSRPMSPPGAARPATAPAAAGVMSRAEFLEQARGLGLLPRQVMERLGVRTLEGLNYAEALEQVKRQIVRESTQAPQPAVSEPQQRSEHEPPAQATPEPASTAGLVKYFDEEDDYDVSFELPEDDDITELDLDALDAAPDAPAREETPEQDETRAAPVPTSSRRGARREREDLDREDVPASAEPQPAASAVPSAKTRASAPAPAASANTGSAAPSRPAPLTSHQALAQRARAHDLLARLREYRGGSPAGSDQIGPFTNIVMEQLGEPTVATLTDQVWGIVPGQLTAPQMRALIQWGKTDAFSAEVDAVLDLLASERPSDESGEPKSSTARTSRPAARPAGRGTGSAR